MCRRYSTKQNSDVLAGNVSEDEALLKFLKTFDSPNDPDEKASGDM